MPAKSRRKKSRAVAVAAKNISVAAEPYVPTRAEGDALVRFKQRLERTPASAPIKVEIDGDTSPSSLGSSQSGRWSSAMGQRARNGGPNACCGAVQAIGGDFPDRSHSCARASSTIYWLWCAD